MDGRPSISLHAPCGRTDADAAPTDSVGADSPVIYFGNAQRISKGFAIALRAMGVGADILPADPAPPNPGPNQEEN